MPDPAVDPVPPQAPPPDLSVAERWAALPGNVRGGIIFMAASAVFSVMIAMIKMAGERLHVTEILFFRQLTMVALAAPAIIAGWPGSVQSARPKLQLARIGIAFLAMTFGFAAVIHLPLAEATVISFSKTFFTTVLAIILLGEIVRLPRWTALVAGFIGGRHHCLARRHRKSEYLAACGARQCDLRLDRDDRDPHPQPDRPADHHSNLPGGRCRPPDDRTHESGFGSPRPGKNGCCFSASGRCPLSPNT